MPIDGSVHPHRLLGPYRHWRGAFYPEGLPARRWFDHYAARFDTVEINASFYRLPTEGTFAKWHDQTPPGFCYSVRANRFLTQTKKLLDCAEPLERVPDAMRNLGDRLDPDPLSAAAQPATEAGAARYIPGAAARRSQPCVRISRQQLAGARYPRLARPPYASFFAHDMPGSATPRWATGSCAYVRFHGTTGKYVGRDGDRELADWADWMCGQAGESRGVWAYFNNDIHAHAIGDALSLKAMIAGT